MKNTKKILILTLVIGASMLITFSCRKESNTDQLNTQLSNTESIMLKASATAKTNDDLLKLQVSASGQFTAPGVMMEDSLYHMNDSIFNSHYLTYCQQMKEGDNMMGNNMMGGNNMHGSSMMGTHTYMGDTALINQNYRMMNSIRINHALHHPIK